MPGFLSLDPILPSTIKKDLFHDIQPSESWKVIV
jgi:hypothetical protein